MFKLTTYDKYLHSIPMKIDEKESIQPLQQHQNESKHISTASKKDVKRPSTHTRFRKKYAPQNCFTDSWMPENHDALENVSPFRFGLFWYPC